MKKSSFVALVLGTISGVLFAFGMCMALVEEWAARTPGIVCGCVGVALGCLTVFLWRRMEHKAPIRLSCRALGIAAVAAAGTLLFGAGLCLCLSAGRMVLGIVLGLAGILVLFCLIPMVKGLK